MKLLMLIAFAACLLISIPFVIITVEDMVNEIKDIYRTGCDNE